ncbi:eukaryotic-like serine/threonine-protein kinase [Pararobbsia alpina]|uniref:serine/threonine protein kinase n=1 Tax=Pararobbsia alpina TaxID=621374 RepID=UPI0039A4CD53
MASLAFVIHNFHSGSLTHDEFFEQIDSTLSADGVSSARLLETLRDEQSRMPLPPDLYAELRRRIELLSASNAPGGVEETRVLAADTEMLIPPGQHDAPSLPSLPSLRASAEDHARTLAEMDQTKGIGDTLNNRFVLEECLGVGGMGTVYKALDLRKLEASDRRPYVAIKVLNLQFRGNPKSLIALQREARKAQTLAHRNIVTVYDFDRDGPVVFLTMEYLQGKPLSRVLRAPNFKGMPIADALPIVRGMGHALAYAHERGFVHCDFKPANVFLTDAGEVKVIDFGIARVFQRPEQETDATVFDPGSLGALTPAYASPEMLEHLEPDPRDDIYALGCITYEMLTGVHPFDRLSATQARNAHFKLRRPDALGMRQWRALKCALSFDRELRTPTVARFVSEMGAQQRERPQVGMWAKSAIGFGVLAVLGIGAYWYRSASTGHLDQPPVVAKSDATAAPTLTPSKGSEASSALSSRSLPNASLAAAPASSPASEAALTRSPTPPTVSLASATARTAAQAPAAVSAAVSATPPLASASAVVPVVPPLPSTVVSAASLAGPGAPAAPTAPPAPLSLATVMPVLSQVPCSALSANVHDHTVQVRGFAPPGYNASKISEMLRGVNGASTRDVDVETIADDKCEVVKALSPFMMTNWQGGHPAAVKPRQHNGHLSDGDSLIVDVTTPAYETYVSVDYFELDGSVVHLVPSLREKDNQAPPNYSATVGSEGGWVISKPFGSELIVLTTTPVPVFDVLRPPSESRAEYLAALQPRLKQISDKYGADKVDVDMAQITTRAARR